MNKNLYHQVSKSDFDLWSHGKWLSTNYHALKGIKNFPTELSVGWLKTRWCDTHGGSNKFSSSRQSILFSLLTSYVDIFYPCLPYAKFPYALDEMLDVCILHLMNHCVSPYKKFRSSLNLSCFENNKKRSPAEPKVLILTSTRNRVWSIMNRIIQLSTEIAPSEFIHWKNSFRKDFSSEFNKDNLKNHDHPVLIGNNDDNFCLGIKFIKYKNKAKIKLYSAPKDSDILISSPKAINNMIQSPTNKNLSNPENFWNSLEIIVIEDADLIEIQNLSHLIYVLKNIHRQQQNQNPSDILSLHDWCLAGMTKVFRQTIVISSSPSVEMLGLFEKYSNNRNGRWKLSLKPNCLDIKPSFWELSSFEGFRTKNIISLADDRFSYFVKVIWPQITQKKQFGLLIFVKSYFDFTRLKHFLKDQTASFTSISEYSTNSDIAHSKTLFSHKKRNILLLTERSYFYFRNIPNGIKSLLFYSLPEHIETYKDLVSNHNQLCEPINYLRNLSLFSKYDAIRLGRIVGNSVMKTMLGSIE